MAVDITNEVKLHSSNDHFLLEELREFIASTKEMADNTKVRVSAHLGQRDPYVELVAKYGDIDTNRY